VKRHKSLTSSGTRVWTVKQPVAVSADVASEVTQTERWASRHVEYQLPVDAGQYELTLWFAETNRNFQVKGKRTIRITANETELAGKLDVFSEAGADTPWAFR